MTWPTGRCGPAPTPGTTRSWSGSSTRACPPPRSATRAGEGVPVVSMERPRFAVDGSVVYPNFNHGVYMAEHLATLVPPGARVAVVGGPDVVDDIELMAGLLHGVELSGLTRVNDPEDPRYKNTTDVASGGQEKTANLLADFGQLDGLIPFNDETMLGAVEALREAGRLGEVKMVSRNGTPAAVELVRAGVHHGTWDIDPPGIGQAVADLVVRLTPTEDLDGLCVSSPIGRMITPERAAAWVPWQQPDRVPRPQARLSGCPKASRRGRAGAANVRGMKLQLSLDRTGRRRHGRDPGLLPPPRPGHPRRRGQRAARRRRGGGRPADGVRHRGHHQVLRRQVAAPRPVPATGRRLPSPARTPPRSTRPTRT